jgi:hypothetical protein
VWAAKARDFSGYEPPHTQTAVTAFTGLSVAAASTLADDVAVGGFATGGEIDYEQWRSRVRERLTDHLPVD